MPAAACGPLLCQPFLNGLVFLYETVAVNDLGVAVIVMTVVIRLLLLPLFQKSIRHQLVAQRLQPELKRIQEKYKKNPEVQMRETLALHRAHGVNPFTGFGVLILTLVILFPLYRAFLNITAPGPYLYPFSPHPDSLNVVAFGLLNLSEPSRILTGVVALAIYVQSRLALVKRKDGEAPTQAERISRKMVWIGPIITAAVLWVLPAVIGLYILASTVFSIAQQYFAARAFTQEGGASVKSAGG